MGNLTALLSKIRPAVDDEQTEKLNRNSTNNEFVDKVTLINVKRVMNGIVSRSSILKEMTDRKDIMIIGGMHDLATGEVTFTV
jgi:carbonic anhydrase